MTRFIYGALALAAVTLLPGMAARGHAGAATALRTVVGNSPDAIGVDSMTGRVFVANQTDNSVSVLDAASGTVVTTVRVGPYPNAIGVDDVTGRVFVVGVGSINGDMGVKGSVSVLDARTGTVLRTLPLGNTSTEVAVDARTGRVFVTNQGSNTVSVLDARTGALVRTVAVGSTPYYLAVDAGAGRVLVADTGDNKVYVLDAATGAVLHATDLGDIPGPVAVDATAHRAYVGFSLSSSIRVLDTRTGRAMGSLNVATPQTILADGPARRVYVFGHAAGSGGTVAVIDPTTGKTLRTISMLRSKAGSVDAVTGRVLVADLTGTVYVLDGRSGRTLRTAMADEEPQAVAIDTRMGRAFVASLGPLDDNGSPTGRGTVTMVTMRQ